MNNQIRYATRYATFGERFTAVLRDCLYTWWIAFVGFFLIQIIQIVLRMNDMINDSLYSMLTTIKIMGPILFIILGQPLYAMVGDVSGRHTSKGKFKNQIYVLNKKGQFLTLGQSFLRMILKYATLSIPFGLIATIIVMCCTEKKQALHDLILGHVVVKNI